jgi:thiol-disulfide isomerase/thioredoxin
MRKNYLITIIVILVTLASAVIATYLVKTTNLKDLQNQAEETLFKENGISPYVDMKGRPVSLEQYLGSVLVVNSWASWSPFSTVELPQLEAVANLYESKGVIILAVNRKESKEQAERFLNTIPPLVKTIAVIDTSDFFYSAIGGYAMPETVIYDRAGTIIYQEHGVISLSILQNNLDRILDSESNRN